MAHHKCATAWHVLTTPPVASLGPDFLGQAWLSSQSKSDVEEARKQSPYTPF